MPEREFAALDSYQLIPRVLHEVTQADTSAVLFGRTLPWPMVPRSGRGAATQGAALPTGLFPAGTFAAVAAEAVLDEPARHPAEDAIAVLQPRRMADLVPEVKRLVQVGVYAIGLDLGPLADSAPFGKGEWRPRTREDLAELRGAAGCPLWLFGISSAADAEVAAEAGVDAVVISREVGRRLGSPAVIDILPEVLDAVGGMLTIASGGPVRDGFDLLRYLAVGAEAVVVDGERPLAALGAEFEYALRLTGCASVADLSYDVLFEPLFREP